MADLENQKKGKKTFSEWLTAFLTKNRKVLIGLIIVLFAVAIIIGVFTQVKSTTDKRDFQIIDEATVSLKDANDNLSGEELDNKLKEIKDQITGLAEKNAKNIVGARAYMFLAEMDYAKSDWASAAVYWTNAANAGNKAYIVPICWYNAAVCYEELDNNNEAVICYEKAVEFEDFPTKSHAIFNLGRINEAMNDYTKASEWYQKLQDDFSNDSWASLGMSRLIALRVESKIQ